MMWRFLAGGAAGTVFLTAGFFLVRTMASTESPIAAQSTEIADKSEEPDALATPMTFAERLAPAPKASEKTKEEKRFNRFDKDKNGGVSRDEYLQSRHKAYAKLDINGDGKLSFEEYATKTVLKFAKADSDQTGVLNRSEFSATRPIRKSKPKPNCMPSKGPVQVPSNAKADDDA
jgi:Ca2+-binding EF-hand superfamily protein